MEREIVFRGKTCKDSEWVYGYLGVNGAGEYTISTFHSFVPIEDFTIGQFTGVIDKNGKRIFEGDIVRTFAYSTNMQVRYCEAVCGFGLWRDDIWYGPLYHNIYEILVVGNVYDNPDLLEN